MSKGKAQAAYQPAYQSQADAGYQGLTQNAIPYATALPGQVQPGLNTAANNIASNPYMSQAMGGAQGAASMGAGYVLPTQTGAADNMYAMGQSAQNLIPYATTAGLGAGQASLQAGANAYGQSQQLLPSVTGGSQFAPSALAYATSMIPGTTQAGMQAAPGMLSDAQAKAQQVYAGTMGAIPGLTGGMGAAGQVLNTAFDPQGALHDRNYQQTMDAANAHNAMYGLGTSGVGAGVANKAGSDFNLDWQDRQLARQVSGLGAYGTEQGVVANNLTSLMNSGVNNYNSLNTNGAMNYEGLTRNAADNTATLMNSGVGAYNALNSGAANNFATVSGAGTGALNQGVDNYRQAIDQGVTNFNNLASTAQTAYTGAGDEAQKAMQTYAASQMTPYQLYQQQQLAAQQGYTNEATGTAAALNPTASLTGQEGNYLGIGQNATKISNDAVAANNAARAATMQSIGQIAGIAASVALAPATGGMSLFGLGAAAGGGA